MILLILRNILHALAHVWAMLLILLLFTLFSCEQKKQISLLPFYNTPDFTPLWLSESEASQQAIHQIAPFRFTNQNGQVVDNQTTFGKIYVANFFFTACGNVCPMMTKNLIAVQDSFKNDNEVLILSHSVTPWVDSVSLLKEYASQYKLNNTKWFLLTGRKSEVYHLARQSYFAEEEIGYAKDSSEFLHTEHALLIDQRGRIRGVYNATLPLEIEKIIADIKVLRGDVK